NLGFVKCRPGKGVLMHNHDTNETFVVMSGQWRVQWNEGKDTESLEVGQLDVISFPPGCARRFENITHDEPQAEHMLLFVIGGDAPQNEFTPASMARVAEFEQTRRYGWRRGVLHRRGRRPGSDGGRHVPLDPRAEQRQPRHPRQAPDRVVDLPRRRLTLRAAEQRRGEETELVRGLHAGADRSPESLHEE